jgi:uncharacterized membrane protein
MRLKEIDMRDSHLCCFVKGISWRTPGSIDTIFLSLIVRGSVGHSIQIGLTEVITKTVLYYLHERLWNAIAGFELFTKIALFYWHERVLGKIFWERIPNENVVLKLIPNK